MEHGTSWDSVCLAQVFGYSKPTWLRGLLFALWIDLEPRSDIAWAWVWQLPDSVSICVLSSVHQPRSVLTPIVLCCLEIRKYRYIVYFQNCHGYSTSLAFPYKFKNLLLNFINKTIWGLYSSCRKSMETC